jgi:outer membrane protein assembly factor BamB
MGTLALGSCGDGREGSGAPLTDWPVFGRVPERVHYLPADRRMLDPPLREAWSINTHGLIEFPPAVADGVAYVVNKFGNLAAIRLDNHEVVWRRIRDPKNAGSPTDVTAPVYNQGHVFIAFQDGELVAFDAASGKPEWKRDLHSHLESSPVAVGGALYIGSDRTNLIALRASDGRILWQFNAPGAIKASPSHHDGRVYVADYEGVMFCLDAETGEVVWRTNTTKVKPFGEGGFYSSPAIAFGRVYAGRDDGTIFAFDQRTGKVDWSFPTNNFVYGSPSVARVPGTPPTVYIGSYDRHLYALNAMIGKQEWRFDVGGPIPGTATVIGHTVYTSSFKTGKAIGIDVHTHKRTFQFDSPGYTPVVSDGRQVFLVGYFELVGLRPTRR